VYLVHTAYLTLVGYDNIWRIVKHPT
jgi:hypothetical protein